MDTELNTERALARARAFARDGKTAEAAALYRGILERFPDNRRAKEGLASLGPKGAGMARAAQAAAVRAMLGRGQTGEALTRLQPLLLADPGNPDLNLLAGAGFAASGRHEVALKHYLLALRLHPGLTAAAFGAGNMLYLMGQLEDAVAAFRQVVASEPQHDDALNNLGLALHGLGRLEEAEAVFGQSVAARPDSARSWFNLANCQRDRNLNDEAIRSYRKVLALDPTHADAANNLGNVLRDLGDQAGAIATYRDALRSRPDSAACWRNLADLHRFGPGDPDIERMQALLAKATRDADRMQLQFALGKAFDDLDDREAAFAAWVEANRLRKAQLGYDIALERKLFATLKRYFSGSNPPAELSPGPAPIFILGMMRSGTTLVEQILSSHSEVQAAGEQEFMTRLCLPVMERAAKDDSLRSDVATAAQVREGYRAGLRSLALEGPRVTDKMPLNFRWIGFVLTAFPEAKVIHLNRDPMAVGWSIFRHYFTAKGNGYAYDLADIGAYFRMQTDLMAFWHATFPGRILEVNYERLTEDQEGQTRAMLEYCGLGWEPACLDFHTRPGPVRTASSAQVRQKMYQGSSDDWRRYGRFLDPLKAALEG